MPAKKQSALDAGNASPRAPSEAPEAPADSGDSPELGAADSDLVPAQAPEGAESPSSAPAASMASRKRKRVAVVSS